jgi:hypothetical protein
MNALPPSPPPTPPSDPGVELTVECHRHAAVALRGMLPPPAEDTPEAWLSRDRDAIAMVSALVPGNPAEARLAAHHVAALAQAEHCFCQLAQHTGDQKTANQLRAQAACMGREARGYMNALLRLQAVRRKREAKDATRESDAWTEHSVFGLMTDALEGLPAKPPRSLRTPPPPRQRRARRRGSSCRRWTTRTGRRRRSGRNA